MFFSSFYNKKVENIAQMRNLLQFLMQNICTLILFDLSLQYKNKELLYLQNDRRNSKSLMKNTHIE